MKTNLFNLLSVWVIGNILWKLLIHQMLKHVRGLLTTILLLLLEYQTIFYVFLIRYTPVVRVLFLICHQIRWCIIHTFLDHFSRFDSKRLFLEMNHLILPLVLINTWHRSNPVSSQSFLKRNRLRRQATFITWSVALVWNYHLLTIRRHWCLILNS